MAAAPRPLLSSNDALSHVNIGTADLRPPNQPILESVGGKTASMPRNSIAGLAGEKKPHSHSPQVNILGAKTSPDQNTKASLLAI